jgi:NAD(P)H-dependent FMN reductase
MKNIIAFGASSSSDSINKKLASYTANKIEGANVNLLDLNDFEMPIYSMDKEKENGIPELAKNFLKNIQDADGIIISFAEHNGSFSAAFKNIFDWASREEGNVWMDKPMLLMASSPGGMGGKRVLEHAVGNYGYRNKNLVQGIALPNFHDNFVADSDIKDREIQKEFEISLIKFQELL